MFCPVLGSPVQQQPGQTGGKQVAGHWDGSGTQSVEGEGEVVRLVLFMGCIWPLSSTT